LSTTKNLININNQNKVLITINHNQTEQQTQSIKVDSQHHIHILDRSGSMSGSINNLIENVKLAIKHMSDNDYVSIIWFSGHDECKVLIKGAKKDESLFKLLDSIKSTVGLTCFSTPIAETNTIIEDLFNICNSISVNLFTDGEVVVPWTEREEENKIFAEIAKFKDKILAFNTIGYGYYYNQDLLKRISAESTFGNAIHSNHINEYVSIFDHNYERVNDLILESVEIDIINETENVDIIYLNSNSSKYTQNTLKLNRLDKKKNQIFLLSDKDFTFKYNDEIIDTSKLPITKINKNIQPTINNFFYTYAYELFYINKRQEALNIIANNLHDKYLVDTQLNIFTNDEVGQYTKELKNSIFKPKTRYKTGLSPDNYLPKDDTFCIMDLLKILSESNNYYIPSKNYQRIGTKTEDKFNLFVKNEDESKTPINTLTYNKKFLNVSLPLTIYGKVKINAKIASKHNLDKEIDSKIFRTHTLIKDGNLNMQEIECVLDEETYNKLIEIQNENNIEFIQLVNSNDNAYKVNIILNKLPVINRMYVNESSNIENIFNSIIRINELEIQQKVLNFYIKEIINKHNIIEGKFKDFSAEQIEVLQQHGLNKNLEYVGVDNQKAESKDYYFARCLEFNLKGYSSIPSVNDVLKKVETKKKLNDVGKYMYDYINMLNIGLTKLGYNDLNNLTEKHKDVLQQQLEIVKKELFTERTKINCMKIAVVLTGSWFNNLEKDDKGNWYYKKDDKILNIKSEKVKVEY